MIEQLFNKYTFNKKRQWKLFMCIIVILFQCDTGVYDTPKKNIVGDLHWILLKVRIIKN